jgi:hypothetical protein
MYSKPHRPLSLTHSSLAAARTLYIRQDRGTRARLSLLNVKQNALCSYDLPGRIVLRLRTLRGCMLRHRPSLGAQMIGQLHVCLPNAVVPRYDIQHTAQPPTYEPVKLALPAHDSNQSRTNAECPPAYKARISAHSVALITTLTRAFASFTRVCSRFCSGRSWIQPHGDRFTYILGRSSSSLLYSPV